MGRWIIAQLLILAPACLVVLWRDPSFDRGELHAFPAQWRPCLLLIAGRDASPVRDRERRDHRTYLEPVDIPGESASA
jgi:hypothetical protein